MARPSAKPAASPEAAAVLDAWLFDLKPPAAALSRLHDLLDDAERVHAARFRFAEHRRRFVARRSQLRILLGERLGRDPARIVFTHNAYGKPEVEDGGTLRFSASHSADLGLCIVSDGIELGCDLERRDPRLADPETAERLFAPGERAALRALPRAFWLEAFFNCWTRKEAYVKALGLGLSLPLDGFEVSVAPDAPAALLSSAPGWSIHAFTPASGYQAALVAAGETARDGIALQRLDVHRLDVPRAVLRGTA